MVAPLIAGGTRVLSIGAKASARSSKVSNTRSSRTQNKGKTYRSRAQAQSQAQRRQARSRNEALLDSASDSDDSEVQSKARTAYAATIAVWVIAPLIPFYPFQIAIYLVGLTGIGIEAIPLLNSLPGEAVFLLAHVLVSIIGFAAILYALSFFLIRGISCFSGSKLLVLLVCLAGSFTLFINIIPWVLIWVLWVIFHQNSKTDSEH